MSVPNEPIIPPPAPPIDAPPPDPNRVPGESLHRSRTGQARQPNGPHFVPALPDLDPFVPWHSSAGGATVMSGDWRGDLRLKLEDFIDEFVVHGARRSEVYAAIQMEIEALRLAYEKDPDAADDTGDVIDRPGSQS